MGWEEEIAAALKESHKAFLGKYKDELKELTKLAPETIDGITPDSTDLEVYEKLIAVVKVASSNNIKQAELGERIKQLGSVAVTIANKVEGLARVLAV